MKKHTKLFLIAIVIVIAGFIRSYASTIIEQPFDASGFIYICFIAIIVFIIGIVKYIKNK